MVPPDGTTADAGEEVATVALFTATTVTVPPVMVTRTGSGFPLVAATVEPGTAGAATGLFTPPPMISDQVAGQGIVTFDVST